MRHLLSALLFTLPLVAWAQTTTLTEAEAVRRGLARPDLADQEVGRVESAKADALATGLLPNPTFGYSRDRKGGTPESTEETWQLSQTFDVSGRRGLRREAAESRVEAAYAGNNLRRGELAAEIRHRFHEALFKQETVLATEAWVQRFSRVERIVDKLARAGEASGYDRRRLARERQTAEARLSNERADLDRASERLAALLGTSGKAVESVTGVLRPTSPAPLESAISRLEQRPDLQALARRAEAADLDGRAASRGWVPDVTLGVGPKRIDNGITREHGTVVVVNPAAGLRPPAGRASNALRQRHSTPEANTVSPVPAPKAICAACIVRWNDWWQRQRITARAPSANRQNCCASPKPPTRAANRPCLNSSMPIAARWKPK
jgi:cobalt-zinc-cadmium efflux system outer membrane protein